MLSLALSSIGQSNKFEVGLDAGPGLIDLWPNTGNYAPFVGTSASIFLQYNINCIFSIKSGIGYELKGTAVNDYVLLSPPVFLASPSIVKLNYLTLPILAKAIFGRKVKFFFDAGPYLSALAEASDRYTEYASGPTTVNLYKRGDVKPYDSGIQAGLGLVIPIGKNIEFSFEDRNSFGLIDICARNSKTLSSAFLLGFSYKFGSGKSAGIGLKSA